ncbi:MAG: class I SAM-dependent methyltransferase [Hyphomicrobium sp.]
MCDIALSPKSALAAADAASPKAQAFAEGLIGTLNQAAAALMLSIGKRTGLFDAMADGEALTSQGWAQRTGLDERYVREWLHALTTARIIELEAADRFRLPAHAAACLGKDAALGDMSGMFEFIAVLGGVESRIVDCFRTGGGVPYEAFERFHDVMAQESGQTVLPALQSAILPLAPGLVERLTTGIDVLDVGCGLGQALLQLAAAFPNSRFTGYDISQEAIGRAVQEAASAGLPNVDFVIRDATHMSERGRFDLVLTFDAIHDQPDPAAVLAGIRRALRPGGVYLMQDIWAQTGVANNLDHPLGTYLYTISTMHCMTVSLAQGGIGLGTAWGDELARKMLSEAGFGTVETHRLEHDIVNAYYVCR